MLCATHSSRMEKIDFSDFGFTIGHEQNFTAKTGCTVALFPSMVPCGVSVVGGSPGTRETDLLRPENRIEGVHAIVLSGGSAFGLESASGVMKYLREKEIGVDVEGIKVPIVSAAVIFDLLWGESDLYPDLEMGYQAAKNATLTPEFGVIGAGTGASFSKFSTVEKICQGGIGYYGLQHMGLKVGAIVVVNALGSIICGEKVLRGEDPIEAFSMANQAMSNTTIGMVFSNAKFDKSQLTKIALQAQDGLSRSILPSHTLYDGDTIFAVSVGDKIADSAIVGMLSAEVMQEAVYQAVGIKKTSMRRLGMHE